MLEPNERNLYINALKPDFGFTLDRAIGTTYTLNLLTLLTIPFSFAKFDLKEKDDILKDPMSILEAVRRLVGKFYVFCQKGGIKIPRAPNTMFNYLEKIIIQVQPPNPEGIFHPKVWILRFVDKSGKTVRYRFLCLSRNITFDKSWDTILTLEGEVKGRFYPKNKPLAEFVKTLPSLSKKKLSSRFNREIADMAEEIRHVDFQLPQHFDDYQFWSLGLGNDHRFPLDRDYSRMLVVSPFLTEGLLNRLAKKKSVNYLVSRLEELDSIRPETLGKFKKKYYLNEAAGDEDEPSIEISSEASRKAELDNESDFSGLHAKLFVAEWEWDARVWTGSANATSAAFDNANVEFLVELVGKKSRVGINNIIGKEEESNDKKKGNTTFRDLLDEYESLKRPPKPDEKKRELEKRLEHIQKQLNDADFRVFALKKGKDKIFELHLNNVKRRKIREGDGIECRIWPISLKSRNAKNLNFPWPEYPTIFSDLTFDKLTSLFAFELKIKDVSKSFVLNLPIKGLPPDREERLLQTLISTKEKFLRYLILLLYEGELSGLASLADAKMRGWQTKKRDWFFGEELPLFEELVRAYSRSPEKIERISDLIANLTKTEQGRKILPEELKALWPAFQGIKRK